MGRRHGLRNRQAPEVNSLPITLEGGGNGTRTSGISGLGLSAGGFLRLTVNLALLVAPTGKAPKLHGAEH